MVGTEDSLQDKSQLPLRKNDPTRTANVWMGCLNTEVMKQYFDLLKDMLEENDLMEPPGHVHPITSTK